MSHKTSSSQVFPPVEGYGQQQNQQYQQKRSRMKQEFTAIQVGDPHTEEETLMLQMRGGTPPRRRSPTSDRNRDNETKSRLDDLLSRQDQLLNHQMQVSSRQTEIADHLRNQNQSMNEALLKQILANKDSMIASLANQQAAELDDHGRELLQQHIKYMVAIIRRLNADIEGLEAELKGRDIAVIGTNAAVNKLEVHHVTMLHDLRGRIVRCDTAIGKHSKDIGLLLGEIRRLEAMIYGLREKMNGDIHRLEAEMMSITAELERQHGVQRSEVGSLHKETLHRIQMLEDRQQHNMAEWRESLDGNRSNIEHYLDKMDAKFKAMIDKATAGWGNLMGQVDVQIDKNMVAILSRLNRLEEQMAKERQTSKQLHQNIETQVLATIQDSLSYNNAELAKAKLEFRNGFTELQESLANLKRVVEGRRKLMGHQIKRDLGTIRKALFMEMPPQEQGTTVVVKNVDRSMEW
ncbi:protein FAM81A-like [Dreissena polymorpha]|uniref:protein FAM81A-like n=1 Tax=Dreissena polymorpha TaxID=45954 RepID=UPI0022641F0E|nr:protein FAM81A-like [Dreissena polymorpha]XP_052277664.1 protein FAM81A-like [Dreissena polymorpha]XP_052277665.1 protein FAM81A-like [Dreissena polymorpha]XP_052277666.1 protein FAM81A-like [Dreissena polymorpha]